jgi:hypothetical protein
MGIKISLTGSQQPQRMLLFFIRSRVFLLCKMREGEGPRLAAGRQSPDNERRFGNTAGGTGDTRRGPIIWTPGAMGQLGLRPAAQGPRPACTGSEAPASPGWGDPPSPPIKHTNVRSWSDLPSQRTTRSASAILWLAGGTPGLPWQPREP